MRKSLEEHASKMQARTLTAPRVIVNVEPCAPRMRAPSDLSPPPPLVKAVDILKLNDKGWRTLWHNTRVRWAIAFQTKYLRNHRGWSQFELAKKADIAVGTLCRIEDPNDECPTLNTLMRIAVAFDCAFICRLAPWSEWLQWQRDLEEGPWAVASFADEGFVK